MSKPEYYWTPVDQFLAEVWKKNESFAMLTPRIQSPYDLMRYENYSDRERYRILYSLRRFYAHYMTQNNLCDFSQFNNNPSLAPEEPNPDSQALFKNELSDCLLTSHPPVFGHWMDRSGLLLEKDRGMPSEADYLVYRRIFDSRGDDKTRRPLYPTFLGIYGEQHVFEGKYFGEDGNIKDEYFLKDADGEVDRTRLDQHKICAHRTKIIFSPVYKINDKNDDNGLFFPKLQLGGKELESIANTGIGFYEFKTHDVNSDYKYTYAWGLSEEGDLRFSYMNDPDVYTMEGMGFLGTKIQDAYAMDFNIKSQFRLDYYKIDFAGIKDCKDVYTRSLRYPDEEYPRYENYPSFGNFSEHKVIKGEMYDSSYINDVSFNKYIGNTVNGLLEKESEKELEQIFKSFPALNSDQPIKKAKETCYASFQDYYSYIRKNHEIMFKPLSNYFWFMYGALPTNDILWEDLENGLYAESHIRNKPSNDMPDLLENFNGSSMPSERMKEEKSRGYDAAIKFLGLVLGVKDDFKANLYYKNEKGFQSDVRTYHLLKSPYRRITKGEEKAREVEYKKEDFVVKTDINMKELASRIVRKLQMELDLTKSDLDFLFHNDLMTDKSKSEYEKIRSVFPLDVKGESYKTVVGHLDMDRIKAYITRTDITPREKISVEAAKINKEIKELLKGALKDKEKLKFTDKHKNLVIRIINGLKEGNFDIITLRTLYFLAAVGIFETKIIESDKIKNNAIRGLEIGGNTNENDYYFVDVNEDNEDYKEIFESFDFFDYHSSGAYLPELTPFNDPRVEVKGGQSIYWELDDRNTENKPQEKKAEGKTEGKSDGKKDGKKEGDSKDSSGDVERNKNELLKIYDKIIKILEDDKNYRDGAKDKGNEFRGMRQKIVDVKDKSQLNNIINKFNSVNSFAKMDAIGDGGESIKQLIEKANKLKIK